MKKINKYIGLHLLLFMYSFCGVFSKMAAQNEILSIKFCLFYGASLLILGLYAIFWQQVLKKFTLTTAFINKTITLVWGIAWGVIFFNETIKLNMIIGAIVTFIGLILVVIEDE